MLMTGRPDVTRIQPNGFEGWDNLAKLHASAAIGGVSGPREGRRTAVGDGERPTSVGYPVTRRREKASREDVVGAPEPGSR